MGGLGRIMVTSTNAFLSRGADVPAGADPGLDAWLPPSRSRSSAQRAGNMLSPGLNGPEPAIELLERSGELSALGASLDEVAAGGRGRLLLVRGEAGTGKTALVRQFCAGRRSTRVLWGGCDALFTPGLSGHSSTSRE